MTATKPRQYRSNGFLVMAALLLLAAAPASPAKASPFGQGKFGADIGFGSTTSISIDLGGDVSIPVTFSANVASGSSAHVVTVTSTDPVGYYLYAHTNGSTDMTDGSSTIPVSANVSANPLTIGTWGYNTSNSTTDFLGVQSTSTLLKDAARPYKNGDPTTVTYGLLVSNTQAAGNYSVGATYTVVAKNQ